METFSAPLALCAGNSPVPGYFLAQRQVTRSFNALFYLRLNKRVSKQSWGWWFERPSCSLWRHSNDHGEKLKYLSMSIKMMIMSSSIPWIVISHPILYNLCISLNLSPHVQMAAFPQTMLSEAFSWMKTFVFRIKCRWSSPGSNWQ